MKSRDRLGFRAGLAFLLLAAAAPSGVALAAGGAADSLGSVSDKVAVLERDVGRLSADFTRQRGLIGPEEAKRRFSDAVYAFMVGQYDTSAQQFFALVESKALTDQALLRESEWYLAESLFELKNYVIAAQGYQAIVEQGASHPFFPDSVRRLIEIYSLQGDSDRFNEVYRRYVASGTVAASDLVKYTVAKSLWHQGQDAKAKSMLAELTQGQYYTRARYLSGAILAKAGDYPAAIGEFQQVVSVPALTSEDREVLELARLALGRVYYEVGDYLQATTYYESIPPTSKYFDEKLYELVWTFIKQEKWSAAEDAIDIFLVAFPDHRYAVQLKLVGGHLLMKGKRQEEARQTYASVVDEFSPVQARIQEIEANREEAGEYFTRLAEARSMQMDFDVLPAYAVEMLLEDEGVSRSIALRQELGREQSDVAYAQAVIEEIESVVMGGSESIGTFSKGRRDLEAARQESLRLQGRLIEAELSQIKERGGAAVASDVAALEDRWQKARDTANQLQAAGVSESDAYQVYDAQVREVQALAFKLAERVEGLQVEATSTRRFLKENEARLSNEDVRLVRTTLDQLDSDLLVASQALARLSSPGTRRRILAPLTPSEDGVGESPSTKLRSAYASIHSQAANLRSRAGGGDSAAVYRQSDELWARLTEVDKAAATALGNLSVAERREIEALKIRLATEAADLARNSSDLSEVRRSADVLAADATRRGFDALEKAFSSTVLQADMGVVDVYWLQQTEVSDEIERVRIERSSREAEMEARFDIIRQKLQE